MPRCFPFPILLDTDNIQLCQDVAFPRHNSLVEPNYDTEIARVNHTHTNSHLLKYNFNPYKCGENYKNTRMKTK